MPKGGSRPGTGGWNKRLEPLLCLHKDREHKAHGLCSTCYSAARKEWQSNKSKETRKALRQEVVDAYEGRCACCLESNIAFLCIDHINNDGAAHRRQLGGRDSMRLFRWLKENSYPDGFQVLCYNCNCAKAYLGKCPHNP